MNHPQYGVLLRQLRKDNSLTLRKIAALTGISRELIRRYEIGTAIPPSETLKTLLRGLGVRPDSETAQRIISAVIDAKESPSLRAMLVPDKPEPSEAPTVTGVTEEQMLQLLDAYFELSGQPRTAAIEYTVTDCFSRILND